MGQGTTLLVVWPQEEGHCFRYECSKRCSCYSRYLTCNDQEVESEEGVDLMQRKSAEFGWF